MSGWAPAEDIGSTERFASAYTRPPTDGSAKNDNSLSTQRQ